MKTRVILCLLMSVPALALGGGALSSLGDASAAPAPAASAPAPQEKDKLFGRVDPAPADPDADNAARMLYSRLRSQYGKRMFTGQTTQYFDELARLAGKRPVVRAFDMQNYSPHNPWHEDWSPWDDGSVQAAIDWHRSTGGRGIVAFQWHWFSPSGGQPRSSTFYTRETGFDAARAVTEGTEEYRLVLRDIDAVAAQLKRLQAAGVPVLWRPLHEAGGGWFWWGAKGPEVSKKLYYLMFNRLVFHHGLHNLLWVWATPERDWYPGNDHVDIAGYDSYPGAHIHITQGGVFAAMKEMTGGRKMLALTETGPLPAVEKCFADGAGWLFFVGWNDLVASQNAENVLFNSFRGPHVITLD